ncbi:MAG: TIGR04282 family arsenosugar biosynthesis glycosyltransferase [Planctomycetota bacterium]
MPHDAPRAPRTGPVAPPVAPHNAPHNAHDERLIVMAKRPALGRAKTRLARDVGPERALQLAQAFLVDTLGKVAALVHTRPTVRAQIAYAPEDAGRWFEAQAPWAEHTPQSDGDLGHRMEAALAAAFADGAARCVVIGTDAPHLAADTLAAAFDALRGADVCLGPARDGGYYLIGLTAPQPTLFRGVPWSTDTVLEITLRRAAAAALRARLLPVESDIDDGADLARLAALLGQRPTLAPATDTALRAETPSGGDGGPPSRAPSPP